MVMKHICKSGKETGDSSACLLEEAANGRFFEMWKCNYQPLLITLKDMERHNRRAMIVITVLPVTCLRRS